MDEQYRDSCVNRQDINRGGDSRVRVSFFDKDGTRVVDVTPNEAKCISSLNPEQLFYFKDGNGNLRELTYVGISSLNLLDFLPDEPTCPTHSIPCGPPKVQFLGGNGIGALANAIISPNSSSLIGFDILNPGFNFLSSPLVQIVDECGSGSGGSAFAQMQSYGTSFGLTGSNENQNINQNNADLDLGIGDIATTGTGTGNGETTSAGNGFDVTEDSNSRINIGITDINNLDANSLSKILGGIGKPLYNLNSKGKGGLEIKNIVITSPGHGYLSAPNGSRGGNGRTVVPPRDPNDTTTPPIPVVKFTASKYSINSPEEITLSWSTKNVTDVNISEIGNNLTLKGSKKVLIDRTKTYTLTAFGTGGTITSKLTISLIPTLPPEPPIPEPKTPPSVNFISSKYEVNDNEEFELIWNTRNATSVKINQGIGDVQKNGNLIINIGETTTYTLTAIGPGGTTTKNITVIYNSPIISPPLPPVPPEPPLPPQPPFPPEPPQPPLPPGGTTYKVIMCLDEIYIENGGFGYVPGDTATVVPDNGSQVELVINERGEISEIKVLSKGCGYTDLPEIVINSQTGYNARLYPVLSATRITDEQALFDIPPQVQLINVVDCVGIIPPKKQFDIVPR